MVAEYNARLAVIWPARPSLASRFDRSSGEQSGFAAALGSDSLIVAAVVAAFFDAYDTVREDFD